MIRRPPRSTQSRSSAASDVYKRQEKARLPMILATDREAVDVALSTTGLEDTTKARVVHIKNTLDLSEIEVSASLWAELEANQNLSKITSLETMRFDSENNLLPI